jgi:hypothetical protein
LPAEEGNDAGNGAARVAHEVDIVRPEEQSCRTVGNVAGVEIEWMLVEPKT